MKCLRKVLGLGVMQGIKKRDVRGSHGNKATRMERVNRSTLRWFGQIGRTDKGRLTKRISRIYIDRIGKG